MEEISKKITESVPVFFFVYNLKKKEVEFISPQFYELATDIESNTRNPIKNCIHHAFHEKYDNFFIELTEKNRYEGSIELKANDQLKGIEWLELNTFPVKEKELKEVEQVVGHLLDITQKKIMYETLQEEKDKIENMLNMMVHDLRAPFNRIHMIAEILETSMTEEEYKKYQVYIDMLQKQGQESIILIQRLLRLATLKGSANSLDLQIYDLRNLVKDAVNDHQDRIVEKKLKVNFHFPDQHIKAMLDAVLFQQVLANLLSNSIKYTPAGGAILWELAYEGDRIILSIRDTGIGIPENYLQDIFVDFNSLRRKGLDGEESSGLGLFICKEIVKMHQGTIQVESEEGKGTTFTVILPFPESSAAYY